MSDGPDDAPAAPPAGALDGHGPTGLTESRRVRGLVFLALAVFAMNLAIHVQMATNVSFLHTLIRASSWQQSYLESIRETCGILSFFVISLLAARSEPRLAAAMFVVFGAGLASYSFLDSVPQVMLFSLVSSFGLHVLMPLMSSMPLGLARRGREGLTLGILKGVGSAGVLAGLGAVYLLREYAGLGMRELFVVFGVVGVLGAVPCLFMPGARAGRARGATPARMPLSRAFGRRYRLYCSIELLDGMRKQVFNLFAVLVLVSRHRVPFEGIAALMFVSQSICLVAGPLAGRMVDRLGERAVLTLYFGALAVLFVLYGLAESTSTLYVIYVVDNAMFSFRVAVPTYANRIAAKGERTQLLAMGVTMNHVGAVTLPLVGGALYASLGHRLPFFFGCGVAVLSLGVAQLVPARPDG